MVPNYFSKEDKSSLLGKFQVIFDPVLLPELPCLTLSIWALLQLWLELNFDLAGNSLFLTFSLSLNLRIQRSSLKWFIFHPK